MDPAMRSVAVYFELCLQDKQENQQAGKTNVVSPKLVSIQPKPHMCSKSARNEIIGNR